MNKIESFIKDHSNIITIGIPSISFIIGVIYQVEKLGSTLLRHFDVIQAVNDGAFFLVMFSLSIGLLRSIGTIFRLLISIVSYLHKLLQSKSGERILSVIQYIIFPILSCILVIGLFRVGRDSMYYYFSYKDKVYITYYSTQQYIYGYEINSDDCSVFKQFSDYKLGSRAVNKKHKENSYPVVFLKDEIKQLEVYPQFCDSLK